jgi:hypothetical protein
MTKLDQFESAFRAASKSVFEYERVELKSVLVVTDQPSDAAALTGHLVQKFLSVLDGADFRIVSGEEFDTVPELLGLVEDHRPDLICTYRHLHSESWRWPYTLGEYVDVLTQVTTTPVLVLPHPDSMRASPHALQQTKVVMAMTDHLTGDALLVNYAVRLTEPDGQLILTHVEDQATFERYIDTISRIPSIETDEARRLIREQLLKEPVDYIASCGRVLEAEGVALELGSVVRLGRHIPEYKSLVDDNKVDLLVFNTKDDEQLAMHGLGYPLAVELRQIPVLML